MMVAAVFDKVCFLVGFFEACPMLLMDVLRSTLDDAEGRVRFVQTRPCCFGYDDLSVAPGSVIPRQMKTVGQINKRKGLV